MLDRQMQGRGSHRAVAFTLGALLLGAVADPAMAQSEVGGPASPRAIASEPGRSGAADYRTIYVSPELGRDSADGSERQPLQTVTRALEIAPPNTVIVLAPGRYTQASGEVFPLQLKPGVTIQGMPGSRDRAAIIEGGGDFESPTRSRQNAAILAADGAGIAQVAISNPDGYGVWVESVSPTILQTAFVGSRQTGLYVAGGSPRVQGNYFSGNQVAGLIIFGLSNASIQSNIFDATGDAIRVMEGATPEIVGNRMTNNDAGLVIIGDARPTLRDNQITGNRRNDIVEVADQIEAGSSATAGSVESAELLEDNAKIFSPMAPESARALSSLPANSAVPSDLPVIQTFGQPIPMPASSQSVSPPANQVSQPLPQPVAIASTADSAELIPAGAPGAALAALRSGLALAPRAVTEENPDSPALNRRSQPGRSPQPATPPPPSSSNMPVNNNRLAVPNSSIPLGGGGASTIFSAPSSGAGAPPAPPSRAQALGLYYRVFVETSDPYVQDEVRSIVPDAFRTSFEGRTMMQVGAFPTEEEADDRRRLLEDNDFDVRVEYIR
ncbi:MAG: DUF1565 domain-containing protein [Phormidesmis sp.]